MVRGFEWSFFVRLKSNRQANPDGKGNRAVSKLPWKENQMQAHLKGYSWVQLYRVLDIRNKKESIRYFASSDTGLDDAQVKQKRELGVSDRAIPSRYQTRVQYRTVPSQICTLGSK